MSKKPNMRWLKRDEERLNKLVKNFNAKLKRLEKKGVDKVLELPSKLSKKEIKSKLLTRADFNLYMEVYEGFTKKGAEKPANAEGYYWSTQWGYDVIEKYYRPKVNTERAKRRQEILEHPQYSRGEPTGQTMGQMYSGRSGMGQIAEVQMRPNTRPFTQKDWENFKAIMERQLFDKGKADKAEMFKENYIKAMVREGYPDEIIQLVEGIPARIMGDVVMYDVDADIGYIYDKTQLTTRVEAIRKVWTKAMGREKLDKSEWDNIFTRRKLSIDELADVFDSMKPSDSDIKEWRKRLEKYGYSKEVIDALFGEEE